MVEWKKLGDVCSVHTGGQLNRDNMIEDGKYPVVNGGREFSGYTNSFNEKANSITISQGGESAGFVNWIITNFWAGAHCYVVEHKDTVNRRYLYHTLKNKERDIQLSKQGAGIPGLNRDTLYKQIIPIPSLSEQARIVGILDTFTASIENLKQQIAERRKQYEYYRDQLLDLVGEEGVEKKTLGKIGKCVAGATPSTKVNSYWENGDIPWMNSGEVHQGIVRQTASFITQKGYENASTKMLPINTIVIALAGQGKTRGSVAITAIELCTNQSLCGVIIKDANIINKFIYYYLKTRYDDLRRISSGDGTRGGLNLKMIGSYNVPIPSLKHQSRIVSILDTFEASIQNLEAQLKQREKQYEYYRNKLLSFE